jgi:hypothetical protein
MYPVHRIIDIVEIRHGRLPPETAGSSDIQPY